jgi:hypothetical protein
MAHESINLDDAERCMREAVAIADNPTASSRLIVRQSIALVGEFSAMCEKVTYRSSIAVLGNAILAKATNERIDTFSLKASADHPGAYDARRPAEKVLVPASQRYKFHLGVNGPQPLNNQPFFRHLRIESRMTDRDNARPLLSELLALLHRISLMRRSEALEALAAFIIVRRDFYPKYETAPSDFRVTTTEQLTMTIDRFVAAKSEGGARAMVCAAALLDAVFGAERVRLGKTNEPDRAVPGDVALRSYGAGDTFERVFEVRDKVVEAHTVQAVAVKATAFGIIKMTVLAVNQAQTLVNSTAFRESAREIGVDLSIFVSWGSFVESLSTWSSVREATLVATAIKHVRHRLQDMSLSGDTVAEWDLLTKKSERTN